MLYAAKCYWPGVSQTELEQVATRALQAGSRPNHSDVVYRGSLLFSDDDLVLCLFEGPTRSAVKRASERAGIPCERVMQSVWLEPQQATSKGATK
jgi:Nickel responsive protein SCO4226-like